MMQHACLHAIMQVGVLANYELAHSQWVELLQFMLTHCQSAQQSDREVHALPLDSILYCSFRWV